MPSRNHHTPITGTPNVRAAINTVMGEIDAAIGEAHVDLGYFGRSANDGKIGGTGTSGQWVPFNSNAYEEVDAGGLITLGTSGEWTPIAGTYMLWARGTYGGPSASLARMRLYNVTQTTSIHEGLCVKTQGGQSFVGVMSIFTADGADAYRLDGYVTVGQTRDFGQPHTIGTEETYLMVNLWRIGA